MFAIKVKKYELWRYEHAFAIAEMEYYMHDM